MPESKTPFSEQDLHRFWRHSAFFRMAQPLSGGRMMQVIDRGRYNRDAGPDFLDAVLRIDGKLVRGDVEIHLRERDWYAHGHHTDPAYDRVVLHVVLGDPDPGQEIRLENGTSCPQLGIPVSDLQQFLSALENGKNLPVLIQCPLSQQPVDKIVLTVHRAGALRFWEKVESFREQIEEQSWDQLLYRGICEALGYAKNQEPFRRLAQLVPVDLIFSELRETPRDNDPDTLVSALLFGAAGLLKPPERSGPIDVEVQQYLSPRQAIWQQMQHVLQIRPMRMEAWQFFRLRPQNFPTRRIAAVSRLILRFYRQGMLESLLPLFKDGNLPVRRIITELRNFFSIPAEGFWAQRYDFKSRTSISSNAAGFLIGEKRADDLIVNVVLPIVAAYARETHHALLENRVFEVYSAYPGLQENVLTRGVRQQLSLDRKTARAPGGMRGARFHQGLIHLAKLFCRHLDCDTCLRITPPAAKFETEN